jgi:dTDP-glucose 4,6-dehydratase
MLTKEAKVLITGADGFIGSHLVETMAINGYKVRAVVFYNSFNSWGWLDKSPPEIKERIEVFSGDIRDPYGVKEAMKGCDAVIHLAALIAIPYSYHSPETYVDTNIKGTLNILQAAKELKIKKLIHTSTSEVYGTAKYVPIDENHPVLGQSPYSATKIAADQLALSFYSSFDLPVTIARPFNTYGPRQSARAVVPTIISQIASGIKNIKLGALSPTRDFNYIEDTVTGFISILESEKTNGEIINIGSGYEISIRDTVHLIASLMNINVAISEDISRVRPKLSEVERLLADNTKAKKMLNWSPEYHGADGLKKGLLKTIEWFNNPNNIKIYKTDRYNI